MAVRNDHFFPVAGLGFGFGPEITDLRLGVNYRKDAGYRGGTGRGYYLTLCAVEVKIIDGVSMVTANLRDTVSIQLEQCERLAPKRLAELDAKFSARIAEFAPLMGAKNREGIVNLCLEIMG